MPSPSNGGAPSSSSPEAIRTIALVGAQASGKTSLAEALLHRAGAIGAPGSLERGSTVSDHDPLERRMQHSLNSSVLHLALPDRVDRQLAPRAQGHGLQRRCPARMG